MHTRPDAMTLLQAVARFLGGDLRPTVEDEGLRFRVLIAAHLCMVVAGEIATEDDHDSAQLARLRAIVEGDEELPVRRVDRFRLLHDLEAKVASGVRDGSLGGPERRAAFDHARQTLRERLTVVNPRFDLSPSLPGEPR